jgi:hypothetical protein
MSDVSQVWSAEMMQRQYGVFYCGSRNARLDRANVPESLWPLLPYAAFLGISDDWARERLVKEASVEVRRNLKDVVAAFDTSLDEWLAGSEADNPNPSNEYIAFSAMRMAAYYA